MRNSISRSGRLPARSSLSIFPPDGSGRASSAPPSRDQMSMSDMDGEIAPGVSALKAMQACSEVSWYCKSGGGSCALDSDITRLLTRGGQGKAVKILPVQNHQHYHISNVQ